MVSNSADDPGHLFRLHWGDHAATLVSMMNFLLEKNLMTDVTLSCDGKSLHVHRFVLCACSTYFRDMLHTVEDRHVIIILRDVGFETLKSLVEFMYKGEVNVTEDQFHSLIEVAKSLRVESLFDYKSEGKGKRRRAQETGKTGEAKRSKPAPAPAAADNEEEFEDVTDWRHDSTSADEELALNIDEDKAEQESADEEEVSDEEDARAANMFVSGAGDENSTLHLPELNPSYLEQEGERFQQLEGTRRNLVMVDIQEGYVYRSDRKMGVRQYFRCHMGHCGGRMITTDAGYKITREHSHRPERRLIMEYQILSRCKERCVKEDTAIDQIIQEETKKLPGIIGDVVYLEKFLTKRRQTDRNPELVK